MPSAQALIASIPPPPFHNLVLGPVTLHGYGLCLGIAMVVGVALSEWGLKRQGVDTSRFTTFALLVLLCGFAGSRLYHVFSEPVRYWHHPADIIAVWNGGLGIYGGVLGGTLAAVVLGPRFGIPVSAFADAVAPALLAAQAIGRWGNYLNQELFGQPFGGAWALEVDESHRPAQFRAEATFHPTFLYEMIGTALLCVVFLVLLTRWKTRAPGVLFPLYVAGYSMVRLLVEPLRIDPAHEWLGVRQNVWVAGTLLVVSLVVAAAMQVRHRRVTSAASTTTD